jgi:hypothetical protein
MTAAQPGNAVSRMRAFHAAIVCAEASGISRVREIVEWPGGASGRRTKPGNSRRANESAARHAIARSASYPSKNTPTTAGTTVRAVAPGDHRPVGSLTELFDLSVEVM